MLLTIMFNRSLCLYNIQNNTANLDLMYHLGTAYHFEMPVFGRGLKIQAIRQIFSKTRSDDCHFVSAAHWLFTVFIPYRWSGSN